MKNLRSILIEKANFLRIPNITWIFLFLSISACSTTPGVSIEDCKNMCTKQGKGLKRYQIGTVIPIFKPVPTVNCECG